MKRWNVGTRQAGPNGEWVRTVGAAFPARGEPAALASTALDPVRLTGFTHAELTQAFESVRDPVDWRGPIFAEIRSTERQMVKRAVYWFTATIPVFASVPRDPTRLIVTAVGYRLGPAGR